MANAYYGKVLLGELSDSQPIGFGESRKDSSQMVFIGGPTGGQLWISVYCNVAIDILTSEYWYIELEGGTTSTIGNAVAPFSESNSGGINQATGTLNTNAHMYLLHKVGGDGDAALAFVAGDLITQMAIPEDLFRLLGFDWVNLAMTTDAGSSTDRIDAFVWIKPS